ncbi:MAG: hypothetical protein M3Y91_11420 [Actinomycetota bacterium]|nr:hypothetical protein [Actinomycetota bacterium]
MSLTSLLDDRHGPVREWFEARFPDLRPMQRRWKDAGAVTVHSDVATGALGQVGAAFDYRLRFWFQRPRIKALLAAASAMAAYPPPGTGGHVRFDSLAIDLDDFLDANDPRGRFLEAGDERKLAWFCYVLALYEVPYRTTAIRTAANNFGAHPSDGELDVLAPGPALDDLCALIGAFGDRYGDTLRPTRLVAVPPFALSWRLGGADADLILDGCLLAIKVTKAPTMRREVAYQLIGHVLADTTDAHGIDSAGFYLARVPALLVWPVEELLVEAAGRAVDVAELREEFAATVSATR